MLLRPLVRPGRSGWGQKHLYSLRGAGTILNIVHFLVATPIWPEDRSRLPERLWDVLMKISRLQGLTAHSMYTWNPGFRTGMQLLVDTNCVCACGTIILVGGYNDRRRKNGHQMNTNMGW